MALPRSYVDALCVHLEPLVARGRVLVVGDPTLGVGERLLSVGAERVLLLDPMGRASAVRGGPSLEIAPLDLKDARTLPGSFDLVVVPDVAVLGETEDAVAALRWRVAPRGALVAGVEAGEDPSPYYELYELLAPHFAEVAMLAAVPFAGVTLAQVGVEDPDVSVDTQLVSGEHEPRAFFAVGSDERSALAPYAIVQLPDAADGPRDEGGAAEGREQAKVQALEAALAEAVLRAEVLSRQLDERAELAREAEGRIAVERARADRAEALGTEALERARAAEEELQRVSRQAARIAREPDPELLARVAALEAALSEARGEAARAAARVAEAERSASAHALRAAPLEEEVSALRVALADARAELEEVRAAQRSEVSHEAAFEEHARELADVEARLRERARAIVALEGELRRRERIVQQLLHDLELRAEPRGQPGPPSEAHEAEIAELRQKLDALAAFAARREGELEAARWRIAELEHRAAAVQAGSERDAPAGNPATFEEIDALRQALAQEHAARVRAESGEELSQARAELQRQAALIEQLSRELRGG
jgi:chromosome segregation ATPase